MEFIDMDQFFPYLQPDLMSCPEPVMINHLRAAAIELCEHAPVWQYDMPQIPVVDGVMEYELDRPHKDSVVHTILGAWYGNRVLESANAMQLGYQPGLHRSSPTLGVTAFSVERRGYVTLFGNPSGAQQHPLRFLVSLKPARDATEIPRPLYDDYFDCLLDGAAGRAMEMIDRPWTNTGESKRRLSRFFRGKINARIATDIGGVTGNRRLAHRRFVGRAGNR